MECSNDSARAVVLQSAPQSFEVRGETFQLLQMQGGERRESPPSEGRQGQAHDSMIVRILGTPHQTGGHRPVREPHSAVVTQHEQSGDVADRRAPRILEPADGQQELMLSRRDAGRLGQLLAPVEEPTESDPEVEQPAVLLVGQGRRHGISSIDRGTIYFGYASE